MAAVNPLSLDLRQTLARFEAADGLIRIRREVDPRHELAAVVKRIQREDNRPVVFEKVRGTALPVVSNLFGDYGNIAAMLGVGKSGLASRWSELLKKSSAVPAESGRSASAPCREIAFSELPHLIFCEKDAGPYITAGIVLARDPDEGVTNLSFHRMQIVNDKEIRTRLSRAGDLYRFHRNAERRDKPLEVAVLVGARPAVTLAAAASPGIGISELDLAATFSGGPLPMRKCETVDLEVPDDTEIVIEGELLPHVRRPEGPFGEWMDFYVPQMDNHVLVVRRVVVREGASFYAILSGSAEEHALIAIPNAGTILNAIRAFDASVLDVTCYPVPQFCVVRLRKQYEGQAQKAMLGAFGAETNFTLYCVVVDEDVDIHNMQDVLWAMSTRARVDRDVMKIPNVPSFARDPHQIHWGRIGIDATAPLEWPAEFERKKYPGLERIRLEDYL